MNNSKTIEGNDGLGTTTITKIEDKLTVAQEHMNNAFMAVQGILQAHADKNDEPKPCMPNPYEDELSDAWHNGYSEGLKEHEKVFTFSDFDKSVRRTWKKQNFKDAVSNAALGLTGEAGEVADLIKKGIYHKRGFDFVAYPDRPSSPVVDSVKWILKGDVKDELSDVLFYVSAMAQEFGFTLEDVARHNKEKLEKRYEKGFTTEESAQKKDKIEFKSLHTGANVQ